LTVDFRVLELLCGRLCHELISPVGAINNGVELLGEDDPDFVRDAMTLIGQSGRKAGQRLQFYRFAYGASVTGGAVPAASAPSARELATGLLDGGKITCDWSAGASALPVEWQKLACNLLVLATDALPRGGTVKVTASPGHGVQVSGEGAAINLTQDVQAALADDADVAALNSRTIHAYFTGRLAEAVRARVTVAAIAADRLALRAEPAR
jgi:histidine phosphotransferase ChpT